MSTKHNTRLLLLILIGMIAISTAAMAQNKPADTVKHLMLRIRKSKPDTNRIKLQINLSTYYFDKPGSDRKDLDSAELYINQAIDLSDKLHLDKWKYWALKVYAFKEFENGYHEKGIAIFKQTIAGYHHRKDFVKEANTWFDLGELLNSDNKFAHVDQQLDSYQKAEKLDLQNRRDSDAIEARYYIANLELVIGKLDSAEKDFLKGFEQMRKKRYASYIESYEYGIASVYNAKGLYHRALYYQLKLLKDSVSRKDYWGGHIWSEIGITYAHLEMYNKALFCNTKAMDIYDHLPQKFDSYFAILTNNTKYLLKLNKPQLALKIVFQTIGKTPPNSVIQKGFVLCNLGQCYAALKQSKTAGKYFDEMVDNYDHGFMDGHLTNTQMNMYISNICSAVDFFINTAQYQKAADDFKKITPFISSIKSVSTTIKVLPLQIKLDSVSGNYKKAFYDLSVYKKINDSLYNSTKSEQIAEMQTQYETSQKERAIKLLQSQGKTQKLELQTANQERNFTLGGVALLLVLTGLAYNRYRFKQQTNLELEAKQLEINAKNQSLQHLITDKDQLITEKDWLIKEVHHRVKNNLQTVLSLLESQASFLKDDALTAIRTSQHRIYAMSLIHQKLYQDDQLTTIDIALYLQEFIESLKESFGTEDRIKFNLDLQPVSLDAAQAIPVALIVNEAVTNAIKYAFPKSQTGEISIIIKEREGQIELTIADNGIGIDPLLIDKELNSMGLALMKGLTTELKGKLKIQNINGTVINVVFNHGKSVGWVDGLQPLNA